MGHSYGWVRDSLDRRDLNYRYVPRFERASDRPTHISFKQFGPAIYNQYDLGSCTGNAGLRGFEICRKLQGLPFLNGSRLWAYYVARLLEGTTASDAGAQIRDVIKGMARYGVCTEAEWPYIISRFASPPPPSLFKTASKEHLISYPSVTQDLDHIRDALASQIPVVLGITLFESFESDAVASNGIVPMPGSSEGRLGGHAICATGYNDDTKRIECANSWGEDWGDDGYFYLPYDYIADPYLASDLWGIRLVTQDQPSN